MEANAFRAGDSSPARNAFVSSVLYLALETHVLKTRSSFSHTDTHTAIYQRLPSRIYVEMIVTATYLGNGRCDVAGIQKVFRCTTDFSVALNQPSRPSKRGKFKLQSNFCPQSSTHSVVRVWPDSTCHARNNITETPEIDDLAREASQQTVTDSFVAVTCQSQLVHHPKQKRKMPSSRAVIWHV